MSTEALSAHLAGTIQQALSQHGLSDPASALAALCLACGVDVTLLGLTPSGTTRVAKAAGLMAGTVTFGSIHTLIQEQGPVEVSSICIEPKVPDALLEGLVAAGVGADVVTTMYFDEQYGPAFRRRMMSKAPVFLSLCREGRIHNPSGFFVDMIRKNWLLSRNYDPNWREAKKARALTQVVREVTDRRAEHRVTELSEAERYTVTQRLKQATEALRRGVLPAAHGCA